MSIYGTEEEFLLVDDGEREVRVFVQVVPAWIDFPADYLPAPRAGVANEEGYLHPRAAVFIDADRCGKGRQEGTDFQAQQYHSPLLVLSGEEYEKISFREVMRRLRLALAQVEAG